MHLKYLLIAATSLLAISAVTARADEFVDNAKAKATAATARADKWEGPTTGPAAATGKTIVYVAGDLKNGGILGVSKGVEEAAKVLGWTVRVIDGQGTVSAAPPRSTRRWR